MGHPVVISGGPIHYYYKSPATKKESAIPASNAPHSILEALVLAEIGHPRLNSAKPSSFFD
jgi:hypothetical protein